MDLLSFALGIAAGAAFSPFWMKVWGMIKGWFTKNTPAA